MSYIQITLGGEIRGLKFNQLALEVIGGLTDFSNNTSTVYATIYGGLRGNSYVKQQEVDYTFEEVFDWVDEADEAELKAACDVLAETTVWKKALERVAQSLAETETPAKKKKIVKK